MMPLFSREKSSLKGRWRLETVQDMRSSSSNPVSCSETSIKIYGSKEEIRARKSPETVDAPGFAPDASIPVTLYGAAGRIRTADLILTKWLKAPKVLLSSAFGAFLFPRRVVFGAFRSIVSIRSFPRVGHGVGQVAFSNNTMALRRS